MYMTFSFDPVIEQVCFGSLVSEETAAQTCHQVLGLIENQLHKLDQQRVDALLLVGGFAGSEYLKQRIEVGHDLRML